MSRRRRAAALAFALAIAPASGPIVPMAVAQEVSLEIDLVSASGGVPPAASVAVVRSDAAEIGRAVVEYRASGGRVVVLVVEGAPYRIIARAAGHAAREVTIEEAAAGRLRLVLPVDPFELPAIRAVSGLEGGVGGRPVDHVRFGDASPAYAEVGDWLADVPGVAVRSRGPGAAQHLSVRGSRSEDVLVLLDGAPLNDPVTGRADLSSLPTSTLESATLLRGASSRRYGSGASAGVLLLTSRRFDGTAVGGGARMASFGGRGLDFHMGAGSQGADLGLSLSAERARNDFTFRNPTVPGAPIEERSNADAVGHHAALRGALRSARASVRYDGVERGVPGRAGTRLFDSARERSRTWIASAGLEGSAGSLSASASWRSLAYRESTEAEWSEQRVRDARLSAEVALPGVPVGLGARLIHEGLAGEVVGSRERWLAGVQASAAWSFGTLRVEPAAGVDVFRSRLVMSPEVMATWQAGRSLVVWGRVGQGFRLPTFGDLYFRPQVRIRPNPDLEPERIVLDGEAGLGGTRRAGPVLLTGSVTGWVRRTEAPIVWLASSVAVWSPQNLGELRARGIEVEVAVRSPPEARAGWKVAAAGAVQRSRVGFGSNRNPLPYEAGATGRIGAEGWAGRLGARVDVRYIGPRTTSLAATRELEGFLTLGLGVHRSVDAGTLWLRLFAEVENVLDRRYQLVELFPEPGRTLTVRLEARRVE